MHKPKTSSAPQPRSCAQCLLRAVVVLAVSVLLVFLAIEGQRASDRTWKKVPFHTLQVSKGERGSLDECKAKSLAAYFRDHSKIRCPK